MIQATHSPRPSRFPTLVAFQRQGRRFVDWWLAELGVLVPVAVRRWWHGFGDALLLSPDGTNLRLSEPTGAGLKDIFVAEVGSGVPPRLTSPTAIRLREKLKGGQMIFLALPRNQTLDRTLTLPVALAENLRQSLAFELDRYTPFRPDQAYFDYRAIPSPDMPALMRVDLLVAPRKMVDDWIRVLSEIGIELSGIVLAEEFGRPGGHFRNLLPRADGVRRPDGRFRLRLAFLVLATVLTTALLAFPIWQKRNAAIALLDPLARAKEAAQEADARRNRLAKLAEDHDLLPNMKWNSPSVTSMIEELTKLLPDDTFVMQFDFDGKGVQIIGETASSTALVETIERSPVFKDVAFKSPLTKIQGSSFDRFHLGANLEAPVQAKPVEASAGASAP